ncbi:amino acid ABC transporter substrate-binding protein [filamentous cyanobacterium LEGE 11480]|uniref:Amino acid ABC transporter substrate-binding protein n=1 Tax=Romeriopsis navalis LEGE 11480 TaxID=2777977 RepID=A0A928Z6X6_9CYAN|nr:ABC transporter substrate-binding protein [Romeriopsis navalis]MBE9033452.1 amino acid ABC transporter substrate-binding protein [Romeriopsis navalis LEGE 11480]
MASQREWPILIGALLITGGLVATGAWWFTSRSAAPGADQQLATIKNSGGQISLGHKALAPSEGANNPDFERAKAAGITALQQNNAPEAVAQFGQALQIRRNAPETRIYYNNARIGVGRAYTIAVAVPLTSDANGALELLRGVAQAQTEVNQAGGVNQIPLKVVIANDAGNPSSATKVAQALIQNKQILGVVGHYSSDVTLATGTLYNEAGLVAISPVSTAVKLSNFGPYVLRTVPSDYISARALADYSLKQLKRQKAVVFFNSQSGYSESLKAEFSTAMSLGGGRIEQEFDLSAPDFSATRALAQVPEAEVIVLAANTSSLDRALQVVQTNQKNLPILGGDDVYAPKTLEIGGSAADGMVIAVPWHIAADPNAKFGKTSRQFWGAEVNWRTALAYDATQAIVTAIGQKPTREGIQQALTKPGFTANGASGTVRFLASGDRNASIQLVKVVTGQKSGFGFDFVPVKSK